MGQSKPILSTLSVDSVDIQRIISSGSLWPGSLGEVKLLTPWRRVNIEGWESSAPASGCCCSTGTFDPYSPPVPHLTLLEEERENKLSTQDRCLGKYETYIAMTSLVVVASDWSYHLIFSSLSLSHLNGYFAHMYVCAPHDAYRSGVRPLGTGIRDAAGHHAGA